MDFSTEFDVFLAVGWIESEKQTNKHHIWANTVRFSNKLDRFRHLQVFVFFVYLTSPDFSKPNQNWTQKKKDSIQKYDVCRWRVTIYAVRMNKV